MSKKLAKKHPEILRYEELEQRVLFSADVAQAVDADVDYEQPAIEVVVEDVQLEREVAAEALDQEASELHFELVFVNDDVENYEQLIAGLQGADENSIIEVVMLDSHRDGIEQISETLAQHSDLSAVHVITHGAGGQINLGDTWLDSAKLQENSEAISGWGSALTETGDILFYGCNVAEDTGGLTLLADIADLTGADVAASNDPTGHENLGGDWDLEYSSGAIEAEVVVSSEGQEAWEGVLATFNDLDATQTYIAGGSAVVIDGDITLSTSLTAPDFDGTTLTLTSNGTTPANDIFSNSGNLGGLNVTANITLDGGTTSLGVVSQNSDGVLMLTFNSNATLPDINEVMQSITYRHSVAEEIAITIDWKFDGISGGDATLATGSITISTTSNSPAVFGGDTSYTGNEGATVAGDLDATDADGLTDGTYFSVSSQATNGTASIDAETGVWTYTPENADWYGTDSFMVTVTDDLGGTTTQVVNISLSNVADHTVVVDTTNDTTDGDTTSIDTLLADRGADGVISLREAIAAANNTANIDGSTPDEIHFEIPDTLVDGAHTIQVGNAADGGNGALPDIMDAVILNGTTDTDFSTTPIIELAGNLAGAGVDGLTLNAGSSGSTIKGIVVNQFDGNGIHINSSDNNTISGNFIGTDVSGTLDRGNTADGIFIEGSAGNLIGGTTAADRNLISGNDKDGIRIDGAASSGNQIQGNYIGTDITGTANLGNFRSGVRLATGATGNLIGGTSPGAGNIVASSMSNSGIVSYSGGINNSFLGNVTRDNLWLGIHFTDSGTPIVNDLNDPDTGPNNRQNFPVITVASLSGTDLALSGTLNTDGLSTQYRLEFFGNPAGTEDGSGYGEGQVYLGSTIITTDGTGNASFSGVVLSGVSLVAGDYVTATATRIIDSAQVGLDDLLAYGDTSELAANVVIAANTAASISGDTSGSGNEGDTLNGTLTATDVDGLTDGTYFSVTTAATNGTVVIDAATGAWTFTPTDANWHGTDSFQVTVTDDQGGTTTQVISLTLAQVNDGAVFGGDTSGSGAEDSGDITGTLTVTDAADGMTAPNFTVTGAATNGMASIDAGTGAWNYTPDADFNGSDSFIVQVTDDDGNNETQVISITVTPANDAPSVTAVNLGTVSSDENIIITQADLLVGSFDADGDTLTAVNLTLVSGGGHITDNGDGSWTFASDANWDGTAIFDFGVSDGTTITFNSASLLVEADDVNTTTPEPDEDDPGETDGENSWDEEDTEETDTLFEASQPPDYLGDLSDVLPVMMGSADEETEDIIYLADESDSDDPPEERENEDYYLKASYKVNEGGRSTNDTAVFSMPDFNDDTIDQNVEDGYDNFRKELDDTFTSEEKLRTIEATVTMATFAIGFVIYLLRAASLVAGMISALPVWSSFDPIAVFAGKKKKKKDQQEPDETASEQIFSGERK